MYAYNVYIIQGLRLLASSKPVVLYRTNAVQKWEFDRIRICSWIVLEVHVLFAVHTHTTERHVHMY